MMIDILKQIQQLHDKGYVHLDIKPDNVLVFGDKCCLTDFGLSEKIGTKCNKYNSNGKSLLVHIAPERYLSKNNNENLYIAETTMDLWSLKYFFQRLNIHKLDYLIEKACNINPNERKSIGYYITELELISTGLD